MRRLLYFWIPLLISLSLLGLRCATEECTGPDVAGGPEGPAYVALEVSSSRQFTLAEHPENTNVAWYVNGIFGGNPAIGMITPTGLFVAPPQVPEMPIVTVTGIRKEDPVIRETTNTLIIGTDRTPFVEIVPDVVTAVATDSVRLECAVHGCETSDVTWSLELLSGDWYNIGSIRQNGTYVAPTDPDGDLTLMVIARSTACPDKSGMARVTVKEPVQFFVEAEEFADSSGTGITRGVTCGGGRGVSGLNAVGEWISIPITVAVGGKFLASVRYAAGPGDELSLNMAVDGCHGEGSSEHAGFLLDEGSGVGG
jgi:hypothetical protein